MRAVVLSIGAELLRGDIVDTNAAFLARELSQLGFDVQRVEQIGDDLPQLAGAVRAAMRDAPVVLSTGGLGPTEDDVTREAIAEALGEQLTIDPSLLDAIQARFAGMGRTMPLSNQKQAAVIASSRPIPNPNGTAPGWYVERGERVVVAMPGPPAEMRPMFRDVVGESLANLLSSGTAMASLMTFGLGESSVAEKISDVIHWRPDVIVATYAKTSGVEVHVTARATNRRDAEVLAGQAEDMLRGLLGDAVFGSGEATLSSVVGAELARCRLELAVMESCTGGELANLITDAAGSSEYFRGGVVAYTEPAKFRYGVSREVMTQFGLISPETAMAMANAARGAFDADIGIGVTGVAGEVPVEEKAPGTVFLAISSPDGEWSRKIVRPGSRETVKRFAAQSALDLLRRTLSHRPELDA